MNIKILKQITILSLFLGAGFGILTSIPIIGSIAFCILMCISSTIVMLVMTKHELLDIQSIRESTVLGSIIGFISFIGFSLFYVPIIIVLAKFFNIFNNYGVSMALSNAGIGIITIFILFIAILSATLNAFSGFLTYYGMKFFNTNKKDNTIFKLK